jgi:hypothetical protein
MITASRLLDFHEICQLKYRYIRALDTQNWDLLADCFTDDIVLWPNGGDYVARGRDAVMAMVKAIVIDNFYSSHIAVHPEIDFIDDTHAKGIWRLEDIILFTGPHPAITHTPIQGGEQTQGAGYYYDQYVKGASGWKMSNCGFMRIFEAMRRPGSIEVELAATSHRGVRTTPVPS